jgi:hypothetical protein
MSGEGSNLVYLGAGAHGGGQPNEDFDIGAN